MLRIFLNFLALWILMTLHTFSVWVEMNPYIHNCLGKNHFSLAEFIDYSLLLSGSSFIVGTMDKEPRNSLVPTTPAKPETLHIMTTIIHNNVILISMKAQNSQILGKLVRCSAFWDCFLRKGYMHCCPRIKWAA